MQPEKGFCSPADLAEQGERDWRYYRMYVGHIITHYDLNEPMGEILDVGSGTGYFLDCCRIFGFSACGVEGEPNALRESRDRGHAVETLNLETDPLPYEESRFSVVFCNHVIEHLPREAGERLLVEILRVLRPGGALHLNSPSRANVFCRTMPRHQHCWKPRELRETLERLGYQKVTRRAVVMRWWEYFRYRATWIRPSVPDRLLERILNRILALLWRITRLECFMGAASFVAYRGKGTNP